MSTADAAQVEVFLVDDEKDVTDALVWLLDSVKIRSRAFSSASAFLQALEQFEGAACAVVDLRMPEMSGLELQSQIAKAGYDLPFVFLTAHGDVPAAVNAMQAGAIDFVQKPFHPDNFLASINRAMRIAAERYAIHTMDQRIRRKLEQLSYREQEVLRGLLDGRTSKEIATVLDISPKTVDVHRANLMKKLGVTSGAELIRSFGQRLASSNSIRLGTSSASVKSQR